jgi:hypothetical protein
MLATNPKGLPALLRFGTVVALSAACGWCQIAYHAHGADGADSAPPALALSAVPSIVGRVTPTHSCLLAAPDLTQADLVIAPAVAVPAISERRAHERTIREGHESVRTTPDEWRGREARSGITMLSSSTAVHWPACTR